VGESQSLEPLLTSLAQTSEDEARQVLVSTGQQASVRKRLTLQLSEAGLETVVQVVEPGQAPFVIAYTRELDRHQEREQFLPTTTSDFRVARWEFVLSYLLVERGSEFNRRMFVRSTLDAIARRYRVDRLALLAHLREAVDAARFPESGRTLRTVLDELWATEPEASKEIPQDEPTTATLNVLLERNLPSREAPVWEQLLLHATESPAKLRRLLLRHWQRPLLRQRLAERAEPLLEEIVRVLLPAHSEEVLDYGRRLQRSHERRPLVATDTTTFRRTRWRFFLDCLVPTGSSFSTRAFIRATIERLANHYNLEYGQLLSWLRQELTTDTDAAPGLHPIALHLEVLHRDWASSERSRTSSPTTPVVHRQPNEWERLAQLPEPLLQRLVRALASTRARELIPFVRELHRAHERQRLVPVAPRDFRALIWRLLLEDLVDQRGTPTASQVLLRSLLDRLAGHQSIRFDRLFVRLQQAVVGRRSGTVLQSFLHQWESLPSAATSPVPAMSTESTAAWVQRLERKGSEAALDRLIRAMLPPAQERLTQTALQLALELASSTAQRVAVKATVVVFLLEHRGRVFSLEALLEVMLTRVARPGRMSWSQLQTRLIRRPTALRGSLAEGVTRLAIDVVRQSGAPGLETAPVGELERLQQLLLSTGEASLSKDSLDRVERETTSAGRQQLVAWLLDEAILHRALRLFDDAALLKLHSWQAPNREAVKEALQVLDTFWHSPRFSTADAAQLRRLFWGFVWSDRSRPMTPGRLRARFFAWLTRREPRLLTRLQSSAKASARGSLEAHSSGASTRESRSATAEVEPHQVFPTPTAGVVLLWPLLGRYFERLALTVGGQFQQDEAREKAVALVHFLATGQTTFTEADVLLSKVLCGLAPDWPVPTTLELDDETRALSEGLLTHAVRALPTLKNTSINGFRGSFLCRQGQLTSGEEHWTLDVEHKVYDLLLAAWPWPLSVVKTGWMPQPLFVHWKR
jgi:hypothetical protein